jgi:hypothetical protein
MNDLSVAAKTCSRFDIVRKKKILGKNLKSTNM